MTGDRNEAEQRVKLLEFNLYQYHTSSALVCLLSKIVTVQWFHLLQEALQKLRTLFKIMFSSGHSRWPLRCCMISVKWSILNTIMSHQNMVCFPQSTYKRYPIAQRGEFSFGDVSCESAVWFKLIFYTARFNKVERGVYWFHLVRLSVCLSVDIIVSTLYLQQYLSDPFHICTSYQASWEGVLRVMFVSKFENSKILANS